MVDNSAGLLERVPGRAGLAPARGSRTPIRRGHAVILLTTRPIVGRYAGFAFACPAGGPRLRNCGFPSSHAEFELSTMSRGTTPPTVLPLDMVGNSAGLLERAPGRAEPAPARVRGTPIRRGHAVILVATPLIVDQCAGFDFAYPVGGPRPRNCGFPSPHAEFEL